MVAKVSADRKQCGGHRIGGERAARQDRAERRSDQQALEAGFRAKRPGHFFVRQNFRDESAEQAAGEHARQDAAKQGQIMREDIKHAIDAVAPVDQARADHDQHGDKYHRPADRLADTAGARLGLRGIVGRRRVFDGRF
jgi:hypothetical protein